MGGINYCPLVGGQCKKPELEVRVQSETFFLAEPFKPERERKRREHAIQMAVKEALKENFSERCLRIADKEPKDPTIFCDICRSIQSSAYGIVDISGLNPNVLLELGMMFSLGKPVFVLVKKSEEEDLRKKLPSDIVWKRVVPYEEFIDVELELSTQLRSRPHVEPKPSLAEEAKEMFAEADPAFARRMDAKFKELREEQKERYDGLEKLLKKAKLNEAIPREKEIEIPLSLEKQIGELHGKLEQIEKLIGFSKDPKTAYLRGNWHYHRGEYDKALDLYDWALTLKSDYFRAFNNKGAALAKLGKHEEAIAHYDKAIELKPDDFQAWYNKGLSLCELGKHEEAIAHYDKAIELRPDYFQAWNGKGIALSKLGKHKKAKKCFDKADAYRGKN